jgi:hypothetical protein
VEGTSERDYWGAQGWQASEDEPQAGDKVQLYHAGTGGYQVLSREAADGFWSGLGWTYGAPPEPVDLTKDPALVDQPPAPKPTPAPAKASASGDKKE